MIRWNLSVRHAAAFAAALALCGCGVIGDNETGKGPRHGVSSHPKPVEG